LNYFSKAQKKTWSDRRWSRVIDICGQIRFRSGYAQ